MTPSTKFVIEGIVFKLSLKINIVLENNQMIYYYMELFITLMEIKIGIKRNVMIFVLTLT
jgi:hypothetical protein